MLSIGDSLQKIANIPESVKRVPVLFQNKTPPVNVPCVPVEDSDQQGVRGRDIPIFPKEPI
jgi:hypothetical protein